MKVILTKLIKSIPFIGKWKINSEKYFALHAEPGNYNSPIVTWNEVLENNYYKTGLNTELKNINLNSDFQFDGDEFKVELPFECPLFEILDNYENTDAPVSKTNILVYKSQTREPDTDYNNRFQRPILRNKNLNLFNILEHNLKISYIYNTLIVK